VNQQEQLIEQKSNDPIYMKKYLKIALDIETEVLLWNDALKTNREHLECTNKRIEQLQATKRDADMFENTKESKRASIQEQIALLEEQREEEEKNKKSKKTKRKIIFCFVFVLIAIASYFVLPLVPPFESLSDKELPLRLIVSVLFSIGLGIVFIPTLLVLAVIKHFLLGTGKNNTTTELQNLNFRLSTLERQERETRVNNQQVATYLPQEIRKQTFLVDRINYIQQNFEETKRMRDVVYDEGVLPQKYQNIISVASLYQFLANGICTQIKGHGGIYDTYEYHVKLNDIITNLIEIRKDLHRIQTNQEILYDKLGDIHETLNEINEGIHNAAKEISSNTAMTAEATKRTAIATEWNNRETWYMY